MSRCLLSFTFTLKGKAISWEQTAGHQHMSEKSLIVDYCVGLWRRLAIYEKASNPGAIGYHVTQYTRWSVSFQLSNCPSVNVWQHIVHGPDRKPVPLSWQFLPYIFGKLTSWASWKSSWTCQRGSLVGENALPWQPGVKFWRMHLMI